MKIPSINNSVAPLRCSGAEVEAEAETEEVAEAETTAAGGKLATTFYAINKVTTKITKKKNRQEIQKSYLKSQMHKMANSSSQLD